MEISISYGKDSRGVDPDREEGQQRTQFIFHCMSKSAAPTVRRTTEMKLSIDKLVLKAKRIMTTTVSSISLARQYPEFGALNPSA